MSSHRSDRRDEHRDRRDDRPRGYRHRERSPDRSRAGEHSRHRSPEQRRHHDDRHVDRGRRERDRDDRPALRARSGSSDDERSLRRREERRSSRDRNDRARHRSDHDRHERDRNCDVVPVSADDEKARRLAAWRQKQAAARAATAPAAAAPGHAAELFGDNEADEPSGLAPAFEPARGNVADEFARKQAEAEQRRVEHLRAQAENDDALDTFMAAEVLPDVAAKNEEARKREVAEKQKLLADLQAGRVPKLDRQLDLEEEAEEAPVLEFEVPRHKVKLMIGAGGERIKQIQRRTKTRIQVKKEAEELERAFGTGAKLKLPGKIAALARAHNGGDVDMAAIMIYGDAEKAALAKELLLECVDNKEQKQKQRQKEYDKKKEEKQRNRQIYHMRHTRDYEVLGVPLGTSKAECKAAYRKLALKWHPDRHPNNLEEAKTRFQAIQAAFDSLMSTDEDVVVKAIS